MFAGAVMLHVGAQFDTDTVLLTESVNTVPDDVVTLPFIKYPYVPVPNVLGTTTVSVLEMLVPIAAVVLLKLQVTPLCLHILALFVPPTFTVADVVFIEKALL